MHGMMVLSMAYRMQGPLAQQSAGLSHVETTQVVSKSIASYNLLPADPDMLVVRLQVLQV